MGSTQFVQYTNKRDTKTAQKKAVTEEDDDGSANHIHHEASLLQPSNASKLKVQLSIMAGTR